MSISQSRSANRLCMYVGKVILCVWSICCCSVSFAAPVNKVDIFFLFDDTGSFTDFAPSVREIFSGLVDGLEAGLPGVELGFGVGRFEDYGGLGWDFCSNRSEHCVDDFPRRVNGRPFLLNQPIVTSASVGGRSQRDSLIIDALSRTTPATGGDDPETHIEALWQIATGLGFDGNGDGSVFGLDGTQLAGASATQVAPDDSGDVPAVTPLAAGVISSGDVGGVGFRSDSLKIVIIATEICSAMPFSASTSIPTTIQGRYSTEQVADFACFSTRPGDDRFGFVSDALSSSSNTVRNAVAPRGAATLPETIAALNGADIRVLGMGPGMIPLATGSGPEHEANGFLSALARITGGVDSQGNPLVLDIGAGGAALGDKIVQAILSTATTTPGCRNQDLTSTFAALESAIFKQRSLALKLARQSQSGTTLRQTSARIRKLVKQGTTVTQTFPKQVTVCESTACPATNRSVALRHLRDATKRLHSLINSLIGELKDRKKARKMSRNEKNLTGLNTINLATVPDHTNSCPQ